MRQTGSESRRKTKAGVLNGGARSAVEERKKKGKVGSAAGLNACGKGKRERKTGPKENRKRNQAERKDNGPGEKDFCPKRNSKNKRLFEFRKLN